MGNHEYCVDCGESDYHHGSPCNPAKKAAMQVRNDEIERRRQRRVSKIKKDKLVLESMGYSLVVDEINGIGRIRPID